MKKFTILLFISNIFLFAQEPLTLSKAFELALQNAPENTMNKYNTMAVQEKINQAESKLFPNVNLSASKGKYEYESPYATEKTSEIYKTYTISLSQPLYRPETIDQIEQSKVRFNVSKEDLANKKQKLGLKVAKAYFNLLKISSEKKHLFQQKLLADKKYQKSLKMLPMGFSDSIKVLEAKVNKDKSLIDYTVKNNELVAAKKKLERLIHFKISSVLNYKNISHLTSFSMDKSLWKKQLANNKENKIAKISEKIAKLEVHIRQYEYYPKLDLSLERSKNFTNDPVAHEYDSKAFVQLSFPIYQGGYTNSRVQEAKLLQKASMNNTEMVKIEILNQFEDIWTQRKGLEKTITVLKEAKNSSTLYLQAIKKGYEKGIKNQIDIIDAQAKLESIVNQLNSTFYELIFNELNLYSLIGQLTLDNLKKFEKLLS